jgi:hypothetical protein
MDQDGKRNKGAPVTRPINLKPRNVALSSRRSDPPKSDETQRSDSPVQSSHQEAKGLAGVSMLPVSRRKPAPGPEIVEQIGHRLASVYNSVLAQPIPDRFLDLLAQLEAGESENESGGTSAVAAKSIKEEQP